MLHTKLRLPVLKVPADFQRNGKSDSQCLRKEILSIVLQYRMSGQTKGFLLPCLQPQLYHTGLEKKAEIHQIFAGFLLFLFKNTDNYYMKKLLILFAFLFASISVWSEQDKILKYDFGISTGIPVYSRNDESVFTEESRVIIGTTADVSLQLIKPLRFLVGTDVCADLSVVYAEACYSFHISSTFHYSNNPNISSLIFSDKTTFSPLTGLTKLISPQWSA